MESELTIEVPCDSHDIVALVEMYFQSAKDEHTPYGWNGELLEVGIQRGDRIRWIQPSEDLLYKAERALDSELNDKNRELDK